MRHGLLHALTALALTLGISASAQAAGTVTIAPEGGEEQTFAVAELEPSWDVRERPYTVNGAPVVVSGISIDRLLDRAGVDPYRFGDATIAGGGRSVVLARDQLTDPEAFAEGRPVFYADAQGIHFLRPGTSTEAPDLLSAEDFTISLSETGELEVDAHASRIRIDAGEKVTFTATVEGAAAGEDVRVRWTFDDGRSAIGERATHRFRRPGTYKVVVGATSAADPTGASAIVTIRVGDPPEGPDREGGGTNEDASAPDSGAATGATGGSSGGAAADDRSAPPRRRAQRERRARPQPRPVKPRPRRRMEPRPEPAGTSVTGQLLETAASAPPPAEREAARTGNPDDSGDVPIRIPAEAAALLLVLGLTGAGAWFERRGIGRATLGPR